MGVIPTLDLHSKQFVFHMRAGHEQFWDPVNDVVCQTETVDFVVDSQFQRCIDITLFLVTAHMQMTMVSTPVGQSMDQPRVAVEVKYNGLIDSK